MSSVGEIDTDSDYIKPDSRNMNIGPQTTRYRRSRTTAEFAEDPRAARAQQIETSHASTCARRSAGKAQKALTAPSEEIRKIRLKERNDHQKYRKAEA